MPKLEDEKRFYEDWSMYEVHIPGDKHNWKGEKVFCQTKKEANKLAKEHGLSYFTVTVPTRRQVPVYHDDEDEN